MMKKKSTFGFAMRIPDAELETLKQKQWEMDCPHMAIRSRTSHKPVVFSGAGILSQSSTGQFEFKIYVNHRRNIEKWDWGASLKAGEIIPDHEFYDLSATDSDGRVWKANRLLPNFKQTVKGKTIIDGHLSKLISQGSYPPSKGCYLDFWVFRDIKIPYNKSTIERKSIARGQLRSQSNRMNAWKFRCCNIDFLLVKETANRLLISTKIAEGRFPEYFEYRLLETLQFVLGQPIPWTVMRLRSHKTIKFVLSSEKTDRHKGDFLPPLSIGLITDPKTGKFTTKYHRKLFEKYLKHIFDYPKKRHPLWGQLDAVYEASAGTFIEAQALTLVVAIESLLGNEFPNLGIPTDEDKKIIEEAAKYFSLWEGNKNIKNRIQGSIGQLKQSRALDKMRELAELGAITDDQWLAWQKLRNGITHSYLTVSFSPEKLVDLVRKNQVLLYHLIFYAIGYQGLYMDYSDLNWPIKEYPLSNTG